MSSSPGLPAVFSDGLITEVYDLSSFNANAPALGTVRVETDSAGRMTWYRFVKNTSGSTIAVNLAVMIADDATDPNNVAVAATGAYHSRYRGVTVAALEANKGGWAAYKGIATIKSDGTTAIVKNRTLVPGAADAGTFQSSTTVTTVGLGTPLRSSNFTTGGTGLALLSMPD